MKIKTITQIKNSMKIIFNKKVEISLTKVIFYLFTFSIFNITQIFAKDDTATYAKDNKLFIRAITTTGIMDQSRAMSTRFVNGAANFEVKFSSEVNDILIKDPAIQTQKNLDANSKLINTLAREGFINGVNNNFSRKRFKGIAYNSELHLGGMLANNFALHGGPGFSFGSALENYTTPSEKIGDGYAYMTIGITYFMPKGFFISPTLRYTIVATEYHAPSRVITNNLEGDVAYDSTFTQAGGIGFGFSLGKDWSLGAGINLGVAFTANFDPLVQKDTIIVAGSLVEEQARLGVAGLKNAPLFKGTFLQEKTKDAINKIPDNKIADSVNISNYKIEASTRYTSTFYGIGIVVHYH